MSFKLNYDSRRGKKEIFSFNFKNKITRVFAKDYYY